MSLGISNVCGFCYECVENTRRRKSITPLVSPTTISTSSKAKYNRKSEVLAAALLEFAERGYSGARLQEIAARIGVTRTDVYRYFKTKEALFEAVLHYWSDMHIMAFEKIAAADNLSQLALLKRLVDEIHVRLTWKEPRLLLKIVLGEGTHFPEAARIYYGAVVSRSLAAIRRIIVRGVANGEFRPDAKDIPIPLFFAPPFLSAIWLTNFDHVEPLYSNRFRLAHLKLLERCLKADKNSD